MQEEVYEDCGSDFTPLEVDEGYHALLRYSGKTMDDIVEYCFGESQAAERKIPECFAQLVGGNFQLHYLFGPEGDAGRVPKGARLVTEELNMFQANAHDTANTSLDLLEVSAGEGEPHV